MDKVLEVWVMEECIVGDDLHSRVTCIQPQVHGCWRMRHAALKDLLVCRGSPLLARPPLLKPAVCNAAPTCPVQSTSYDKEAERVAGKCFLLRVSARSTRLINDSSCGDIFVYRCVYPGNDRRGLAMSWNATGAKGDGITMATKEAREALNVSSTYGNANGNQCSGNFTGSGDFMRR